MQSNVSKWNEMQSLVKYEMKIFFLMQGRLFCVSFFFNMRMKIGNETTTQTRTKTKMQCKLIVFFLKTTQTFF